MKRTSGQLSVSGDVAAWIFGDVSALQLELSRHAKHPCKQPVPIVFPILAAQQ